MINKIFYLNISRGYCEFKNCNCHQYKKEDKNKRDKINPKCKNCQHGKCWHFLEKDLTA
jgi:hypothetical protein